MYRAVKEPTIVKIINTALQELDPLENKLVVCVVCAELVSFLDAQAMTPDQLVEFGSCLQICIHGEDVQCTTNCLHILPHAGHTSIFLCKQCNGSLTRNVVPLNALKNNMDFRAIPDELQGLTFVEEMLIARCRVRSCLIKLQFKGQTNVMLSQRALRGNIISFPQNVDEITQHLTLPSLDTLQNDIQILFVGCTKNSEIRARARPLCSVNRARVARALEWKCRNDPHYFNITVDHNLLASLPLDDIPEVLWERAAADIPNDHFVRAGYVPQSEDQTTEEVPPQTTLLHSVGYVDNSGNAISYGDLVTSALRNLALRVPHLETPVSEYHDNFWYSAFPVLFPYGSTGPTEQRLRKVSFDTWIAHCLNYHDGRFVNHKFFAFVCQNVRQRREYTRRAALRCKTSQAPIIQRRLASLTAEDLKLMSVMFKDRTRIPQHDYQRLQSLLCELRYVAAPVENTLFAKLYRRNELRALICYHGLPHIWFTLNPADNRHPLVAIFAGQSIDEAQRMSIFDRCRLLVDNPLAPVLFFHKCVRVFVNMLKGGLFGTYLSHYGVIEAQGRGSLHIHMLVWIQPSPARKRTHGVDESCSPDDLCNYVDSILSATLTDLDVPRTSEPRDNLCSHFPDCISSRDLSTISPIVEQVVRETNMHATLHNATCFKYQHASCRFGFPRELVSQTHLRSETFEVVPKRTNAWLNPYNKAVAYVFRCNHDIKLIPTSQDSKALIYYLTEYATKSELASHELLALLAAAYEEFDQIKHNIESQHQQKRLIIRCINKIGSVREQPQQVVVSELLGFPIFYADCRFQTLTWINILNFVFGKDDEMILQAINTNETQSAECKLSSSNPPAQLTNPRIDYMLRGDDLKNVSLFFYTALIYTEKFNHSRHYSETSTFFFDMQHPSYQTHFQRLRAPKRALIPCLIGPKISPNMGAEDDMYAKTILLLFKPWQKKADLLGIWETWKEALDDFLALDEFVGNPFRTHHGLPSTYKIIQNLGLLNDCETQAGLAAARRHETADEPEHQNAPVLDEAFVEHDDGVSDDEITPSIAATPLLDIANVHYSAQLDAFTYVATNALTQTTYTSQLQALVAAEEPIIHQTETSLLQQEETTTPSPDFVRIQGKNSIEQTLESFPLHPTQLVPFTMVANHVLTHAVEPFQLIVAGEAGTGKSQVIRAINCFFALENKSSLLQITASTGTAAAAIGGATIHSVLKLRSLELSKTSTAFVNMHNQMCTVRYLLIDEISMIDCTLFHLIHNRLQLCFSNDTPFGGICIILFGDLNQFPPVTGKPLYDNSQFNALETEPKCCAAKGRYLWRSIRNVVILSHNFRQQRDPEMCSILTHFLNNNMSVMDTELLLSRVLHKDTVIACDAPIVVTRNLLRTKINSLVVRALMRSLPTHQTRLMVAEDTCKTRDITPTTIRNFLLDLPDQLTQSLPGTLVLFQGCKLLLTKNIDPANGLANGTPVQLFALPDSVTASDYVLVKLAKPLKRPWNNLPPDVAPIFRSTESFTLKELEKPVSIRRCQFPLVHAYAVTDYKAQGASLKSCIIDLRKPGGTWKPFHSIYVMLSRVETLDGLHILTSFDITVLNQDKPEDLSTELQRLRELSDITIANHTQSNLQHNFQ